MFFLGLVRREMQSSKHRYLITSALGGISNAAILAAINAGSETDATEKKFLYIALFVISLLLFIWTQHYILITATTEIQAIVHRLRIALMEQVRNSEIIDLENIGRAQIMAAITSDAETMTHAAVMLAFGIQSVVLIFFMLLYLAYLSLAAAVLCVGIMALAIAVFHRKVRGIDNITRDTTRWNNALFERVADLIEGFKEVRLNRGRSAELYADIVEVSRNAMKTKVFRESEDFRRLVFSQSAMYVVLAAVALLVPNFAGESAQAASIAKSTTALVFVVGACFGLVQSIPVLTAANTAARNIEALMARLQATVVSSAPAADIGGRFSAIEFRDLNFTHLDRLGQPAFVVGPIDFTLRPGQLVIIVGGNGSGKSTFLKLLAGLYIPNSGAILLDGVPVANESREAYRGLMTAVFSDYHLFHRLYGIPDSDITRIGDMLSEFRLADKTGIVDDRAFRTIDLSGGQRRRLALIVALLESRPILLLDEWTADQDPVFRRKFYFEVLPNLVKRGIATVLVTHDDRFVDELRMPASVLRMDDGRLVSEKKSNA
jgi:putative pyoverdin transport system ATP-binding/permease protein